MVEQIIGWRDSNWDIHDTKIEAYETELRIKIFDLKRNLIDLFNEDMNPDIDEIVSEWKKVKHYMDMFAVDIQALENEAEENLDNEDFVSFEQSFGSIVNG